MSSRFFLKLSPVAKFIVGLRGINNSCALCITAFALAFKIGSDISIPAIFSIYVSIAILTFIEKIAGIEISDPILNAKANAVMQSAQELFMPLNPTINFAVAESFKKKKEDMMLFLNTRFEDLERALRDNDAMFYINNKPHACDFAVYHHLDLSKLLDPGLIKKFSRLEKFVEDIESIESIKSYLNSRPKLIDVSVEPKLVIDGIAHPTGVKKT